ncbi:MAG: hypothetical protein ACLFNS_12685 [Desulfobacterales bacterium]
MKIRLTYFFGFLFWGLLLWPALAFSFAYQPHTPVYVKTQNFSPSGEAADNGHQIWRVVPEKNPESRAVKVSFYPEESSDSFCYMEFSGTGRILDSNLPGGSGNILHKPDFLFASGYPAPCDIFPRSMLALERPEASESYKVQRDIGGERFVDEVCIQMQPVSLDEAAANGWIKGDAPDVSGSLRVVKAENCRSGRLISLQVWPEGADWWVYEETPCRQSWQIENVND